MTENTTPPLNNILPQPKVNMKAGGGLLAINPQTLDEAWRYAEMICLAGMYPEQLEKGKGGAIKTPREVAATVAGIILKGMEVGLPPMSALANIMETNRRFSIWGDGAKALVLNSGQCEIFREWTTGEFGKDDYTAHCELKLKGSEAVQQKFSWADAKLANLNVKVGPWMLYPKRQMQMRARSWAMRDGAPHILQGLAIAEEVADIPTAPTEGPDLKFLEAGAPVTAIAAPVQPTETETAPDGAESGAETTPAAETVVDVDQETPIAQDDQQPEPTQDSLPLPKVCATCNGKQSISDETGIGPCPDCNPYHKP